MASASASPDPRSQYLTLYSARGESFNITMIELDDFVLESVNACINYGAQLGASLLLLVVVLLLTQADKRKSPMFILNTLSLALSFIRSLLQSLYFHSGFSEIYAYFSQDYSRVPRTDYATSITADVLTLLLLISVQCSLTLQTQVTTTTLKRLYRILLILFSILMALLAIGFRLTLSVVNAQAILSAAAFNDYAWLVSATNITTTVSICFFCTVFASKLGYALHQRRKLGLRQFGPMQVIFIMGCQTMVIPGLLPCIYEALSMTKFCSSYVCHPTIRSPHPIPFSICPYLCSYPPTSVIGLGCICHSFEQHHDAILSVTRYAAWAVW
jgi:pheromone alpha factor receptor